MRTHQMKFLITSEVKMTLVGPSFITDQISFIIIVSWPLSTTTHHFTLSLSSSLIWRIHHPFIWKFIPFRFQWCRRLAALTFPSSTNEDVTWRHHPKVNNFSRHYHYSFWEKKDITTKYLFLSFDYHLHDDGEWDLTYKVDNKKGVLPKNY